MAILATGITASNVDNGGTNPAMSGTTTSGNLLVAVIRIGDGTSTNTAVATPSNNFVLGLRMQGLSLGLEIWYAYNIVGEASPTVTMTGAQGRCRVSEFSGLTTTDPKDQAPTGTSGSSTAFLSGTTASTSQADELLIGGFACTNYQTGGRTVGASYTFSPASDENRCYLEYRVVSGVSTYSAGMTGADGGNWLAGIVTFKAAATGATASPPVGALTISGQTPTRIMNVFSAPSVGALTLSGPAPLALATILRSPPVGAVTITGQAPTATVTTPNTAALPAVGALVFTGQTVGAAFGGPDTGTMTLAGQAPAALLDFRLVSTAGALTLTGQTPSLGSSYVLSPAARALAFTGPAPTVLASGGISLFPTTGALTITGQAPHTPLRMPPTGRLTIGGQAPTIPGSVTPSDRRGMRARGRGRGR